MLWYMCVLYSLLQVSSHWTADPVWVVDLHEMVPAVVPIPDAQGLGQQRSRVMETKELELDC